MRSLWTLSSGVILESPIMQLDATLVEVLDNHSTDPDVLDGSSSRTGVGSVLHGWPVCAT